MHFYLIIFGLISAATLSSSRVINAPGLNSIDHDINMKLDMRRKIDKDSTQHKKKVLSLKESRVKTVLHADQPAHVIVDEGSSFALRCDAFGTPRLTINWIPENQASKEEIAAIAENSLTNVYDRMYEFMAINSTYTVDCATLEDAGKISCMGFANGVYSIQTIQVTVNPRPIEERLCYLPREPTITEFVSTYFGSLGRELIVPCKISANNGPLMITWQTNKDKNVETWNDNYEVLSDGSLKIKKLIWSDMGDWTCLATMTDTIIDAKTFIYPLLVN